MKRRVLILCTGNSVRSQMAEGLLRHLSDGQVEVASAGTHPIGLNPLAVDVMREIGIDISAQRSKPVSEFEGRRFDALITVCDSAARECPAFLGAPQKIHWSIPDPGAVSGNPEKKRQAFRHVRDSLERRLREFLRSQAASA